MYRPTVSVERCHGSFCSDQIIKTKHASGSMWKGKTAEKRERIKWYHARRVFFDHETDSFVEGLQLARKC